MIENAKPLAVPGWLIGSVEGIQEGLQYIEGYVSALEETRTIQPGACRLNGQTELRQLVTAAMANVDGLRASIVKETDQVTGG